MNTLIKKKLNLLSSLFSYFILIAWVVFLLGFVFAHGVCCGDDAVLSFLSKKVAFGKADIGLFSFDPHLVVLIPVSIGIRLLGNTYWVPGISIVIFNYILLAIILYLRLKILFINLELLL